MSRRAGPPSISGLYSLKVDNISYQTTPQDLRRLFDRYGEIGDIHIPRDRYTKQSKGFGFVRFYSRRDAEHAMDRMDGRWMDGREVRVAMARYERPIDERSRVGSRRNARHSRSRSRTRSRSPRRRRSSSHSRSRSVSRRSDHRSGSCHSEDRSDRSHSLPARNNRSRSRSLKKEEKRVDSKSNGDGDSS